MTNTQSLLSNIVYDSSSIVPTGTAVKGSDYYQRRGGVQTIGFNTTGFVGRIVIEATLDSDPETAGWFDVLDFTAATAQRSESVVGNFTWIRARVENFSAGTITSVTVTY